MGAPVQEICPNCEERFSGDERKRQVCDLCGWPNAPKKKTTVSVTSHSCPRCKAGLFAIEIKDGTCYGCGAKLK